MKHLVLIVLLISILVGCKTHPPVAVAIVKGKIKITSNIQGAKIFVDNSDSGKLTPAILEMKAGKYKIKLQKDGYSNIEKEYTIAENKTTTASFVLTKITVQKVVLIEDFANVSCDPCVVSNKILHDLSEEYKNKIAIIKISVGFPCTIDPFYLHAKNYINKRSGYYKILSAPTIIVNGTERPVATSKKSILNAVNKCWKKEVSFDVSVEEALKNNKLDIKVNIAKLTGNLSQNVLDNVVAHVAIIEKRIELKSPPGSNGEKVFYHVMRKMLPDADGTSLKLVNNKQSISISTDISPVWNTSQITTIVYLQNKLTKEVYQAAVSE